MEALVCNVDQQNFTGIKLCYRKKAVVRTPRHPRWIVRQCQCKFKSQNSGRGWLTHTDHCCKHCSCKNQARFRKHLPFSSKSVATTPLHHDSKIRHHKIPTCRPPIAPTVRNFTSRCGNTLALRSCTIASAPPNGAITSTTQSRSPDFQSCGRRRVVPAARRASSAMPPQAKNYRVQEGAVSSTPIVRRVDCPS